MIDGPDRTPEDDRQLLPWCYFDCRRSAPLLLPNTLTPVCVGHWLYLTELSTEVAS